MQNFKERKKERKKERILNRKKNAQCEKNGKNYNIKADLPSLPPIQRNMTIFGVYECALQYTARSTTYVEKYDNIWGI